MSTVKDGHMELYSGKYVDPLNLHIGDVELTDIAHALSNIARYTGHTVRHYSVAEHSILCAELAETLHPGDHWFAMRYLLHDAHEAYLLDVPKPWKHRVYINILGRDSYAWYGLFCDVAQVAIEDSLLGEHSVVEDTRIKDMDILAMRIEARDLMFDGGKGWHCENIDPPTGFLLSLDEIYPSVIKSAFLSKFNQLKESIDHEQRSRVGSAGGLLQAR